MSRKNLCCILAAALIASALSACGANNSTSSANSPSGTASSSSSESSQEVSAESERTEAFTPNFDEDPYTVHFQYVVASEGADQQLVVDALNEITLSQLNMNVELIPQTIGTWNSTISMMLASNEPLDLFLDGAGSFSTYIESGYVRNWADYLDYLPNVLETLGDDVQAGYVGDFLIGFSQMKERGYRSGLVVRADIMDELGIDPESFSITTEDYAAYDQLTDLFAKVKEAYPQMTVAGGTQSLPTQLTFFNDGMGDNFGVLENYGQEATIVNWFETEDGMATFPDGVDTSNVGYHQDYGWAHLNQFCAHAWEGNDPDIWEQYEVYNANLPRSKSFGFTFNSTVVSDQIAACTSTLDQYDNDLFFGAIDPETGLEALNTALYANGLQDILDAKQEQLDAWMAENNS